MLKMSQVITVNSALILRLIFRGEQTLIRSSNQRIYYK